MTAERVWRAIATANDGTGAGDGPFEPGATRPLVPA
jgi:hypothetical protein